MLSTVALNVPNVFIRNVFILKENTSLTFLFSEKDLNIFGVLKCFDDSLNFRLECTKKTTTYSKQLVLGLVTVLWLKQSEFFSVVLHIDICSHEPHYDSWLSMESSLVTEYFERIEPKPQDDMEPRTCAGTPLDGVSTVLLFDREARRRRTTVTTRRMTRTDSVMARPMANTTVTDV